MTREDYRCRHRVYRLVRRIPYAERTTMPSPWDPTPRPTLWGSALVSVAITRRVALRNPAAEWARVDYRREMRGLGLAYDLGRVLLAPGRDTPSEVRDLVGLPVLPGA